MNKIFLNNFPLANHQITAEASDGKEVSILVGFDIPKTVPEIKKQVVQNVFNCLLVHDKISISAMNLVFFVEAFGFPDTIELLKHNYLELLDDNGAMYSVLKNKAQKKFETGTVFQTDAISWLEKRLPEYKPTKVQINLTLLEVEKGLTKLDHDEISKKVLNEVDYDFKNKNLTDHLSIKSKNRDEVENNDILKVLRLLQINSGLVYSSEIGTENLFTDGAIKAILSAKLSPIISNAQNSVRPGSCPANSTT